MRASTCSRSSRTVSPSAPGCHAAHACSLAAPATTSPLRARAASRSRSSRTPSTWRSPTPASSSSTARTGPASTPADYADILADRPAGAHDAVRERLAYYAWPALRLTDGQQLAAALQGPDIVILDSTRTFLTGFQLDEDSSDDFARFAAAIIDPLFRAGIATLQLDNSGHADSTRARGSSSKGDLADVNYNLKATAGFDRNRRGALRLVRSDTRYGDVAPAFTMELGAGHFGTFTADHTETTNPFRPTALMARIATAIAEQPGLSKSAIRQAAKGKNTAKDLALELLIAEGYVRVERDGPARRHHLARPFDDANTAPCPTLPQPRPGTVPETLPSLPSPSGEEGGRGRATADQDTPDPAPAR